MDDRKEPNSWHNCAMPWAGTKRHQHKTTPFNLMERCRLCQPKVPSLKEYAKKTTQRLSVPQFGDWDQKAIMPDYSMDFSKIRENKKQNKRDPSRASIGNEEEFASSARSNNSNAGHSDDHHQFHQNNSPTGRRSIFRCFNCCVKA